MLLRTFSYMSFNKHMNSFVLVMFLGVGLPDSRVGKILCFSRFCQIVFTSGWTRVLKFYRSDVWKNFPKLLALNISNLFLYYSCNSATGWYKICSYYVTTFVPAILSEIKQWDVGIFLQEDANRDLPSQGFNCERHKHISFNLTIFSINSIST